MFGPGAHARPAPFTPEQLTQLASIEGGEGIDILSDVDLNVKIELGRTKMLVEDVLRLSDGAVVELDKLAGDPVDIYVNDRHVARGEVLILNDNFCVRVSEILEATIEER
ncbi:MAG: flagellar motor switch protein FliN [Phycisphaeraceae bacterium]|nr:flagellar motor switch protein FliN [Phycisphaeraceae bacterium]